MYSDNIDYLISHLATYDVQYQEVNNHGGVINVTCIFAKGSQAQGCFITITQLLLEANYTNVWDSEAFRDSDQNATASFVGLPAGNYSSLILDIEENGTIDRYFTPHFNIFSIIHNVMTTFVSITPVPTAIGTPSGTLAVLYIHDTMSQMLCYLYTFSFHYHNHGTSIHLR